MHAHEVRQVPNGAVQGVVLEVTGFQACPVDDISERLPVLDLEKFVEAQQGLYQEHVQTEG